MGILDDAIREHLELKRRRGADPTEVERLEREALGPVRRVQETGESVLDGEPPGVSYAEADPEDGLEPASAPSENWELEHEEELLPGESWAHQPATAEAELETPPPAAAAPPPPVVAPPGPEPEPSGETVEYDVEAAQDEEVEVREQPLHPEASDADPPHPDAPERRAAQPDDDVLEETPEFLQDAPDHDRLWFEQRPPRDFDFDG